MFHKSIRRKKLHKKGQQTPLVSPLLHWIRGWNWSNRVVPTKTLVCFTMQSLVYCFHLQKLVMCSDLWNVSFNSWYISNMEYLHKRANKHFWFHLFLIGSGDGIKVTVLSQTKTLVCFTMKYLVYCFHLQKLVMCSDL